MLQVDLSHDSQSWMILEGFDVWLNMTGYMKYYKKKDKEWVDCVSLKDLRLEIAKGYIRNSREVGQAVLSE